MAISNSPVVTVNVKGDKPLQVAINALRNIGKKMTTIHQLMALEAEKWIKENFKQEGRLATPAGWKKLSFNTIAQRRRGTRVKNVFTGKTIGFGMGFGGGGSAKILQDRGVMRGSINHKATQRDARAGFGDKKAIWHHGGTKPYTITPKKGKFLVFTVASLLHETLDVVTEKGTVFARSVHHPGLAARPLIPKKDQILPLVIKRLDLYIAAELRKAGLKVRTT